MATRKTDPTVDRIKISRDSTVSMRVIRALAWALERASVPCARICDTLQVTPSTLRDAPPEARQPRETLYRLCELALLETGDPMFGLHWAEQLAVTALDPVASLVAHARTLAEALETLQRFHRLLCDDLGFRISVHADELILSCVPLDGASQAAQRFMNELTLLRFLGLVRKFRGDVVPEHVCFEYPAPDCSSEYARVFGDRTSFNEAWTGMVLPSALLEAQSMVRDAELHEALRSFAELRLVSLVRATPFTVQVRDLLIGEGTRRMSMRKVAQTLGLSDRTLRRRLEHEGVTFADVVSAALMESAKRCLREEGLTIAQTARQLGFTDTTSFHRAFKRWTGSTPASYRQHEDELSNSHTVGGTNQSLMERGLSSASSLAIASDCARSCAT